MARTTFQAAQPVSWMLSRTVAMSAIRSRSPADGEGGQYRGGAERRSAAQQQPAA
jgi:hypothetical protein